MLLLLSVLLAVIYLFVLHEMHFRIHQPVN